MPQAGVSARSDPAREEAGSAVIDRPRPEARGVPGRRTVTITGRGAERYAGSPRPTTRRPQRRAHQRAGFRPDRAAMWAVLLGLVLLLVAATSSHAAAVHLGVDQTALHHILRAYR